MMVVARIRQLFFSINMIDDTQTPMTSCFQTNRMIFIVFHIHSLRAASGIIINLLYTIKRGGEGEGEGDGAINFCDAMCVKAIFPNASTIMTMACS